ncbi:transketolase family protein [Enterococcus sp. BWR-S5]|uniref:transketolase family protein n=1 Tax=Enterococcus sp. BWR-S5 TaxID=2787714 RepID=UPI001923F3B5|nr:transketolase C-terminal domain-containing protein [Enterococcus sp. BWR-S5]MBL1225012.1 transketolase family protein [Enterococcus sp. BWR-S5]
MKENNIANKQAMCEVLIDAAKLDPSLLVLTSDSRGSASLVAFGEERPNQLIEVGIAEQNIVSIAAGLAHMGKHPFVASPACFLSMRSIEQIKVDVAYSNKNVKLVGISGGVSYGALGMSHHSLQDIAVARAIPNLQVLLPADRFETVRMFQALIDSDVPAYIRLGRNPVQDCYEQLDYDFEIGKAVTMIEGRDVTFIATGETVRQAMDAAELLNRKGVQAEVLNVHSLKPFDTSAVLRTARKTGCVITVEEHSIHNGLGAAVAEALAEETGIKQKIVGFPDEALITGSGPELFRYYGLDGESLAETASEFIGG